MSHWQRSKPWPTTKQISPNTHHKLRTTCQVSRGAASRAKFAQHSEAQENGVRLQEYGGVTIFVSRGYFIVSRYRVTILD